MCKNVYHGTDSFWSHTESSLIRACLKPIWSWFSRGSLWERFHLQPVDDSWFCLCKSLGYIFSPPVLGLPPHGMITGNNELHSINLHKRIGLFDAEEGKNQRYKLRKIYLFTKIMLLEIELKFRCRNWWYIKVSAYLKSLIATWHFTRQFDKLNAVVSLTIWENV